MQGPWGRAKTGPTIRPDHQNWSLPLGRFILFLSPLPRGCPGRSGLPGPQSSCTRLLSRFFLAHRFWGVGSWGVPEASRKAPKTQQMALRGLPGSSGPGPTKIKNLYLLQGPFERLSVDVQDSWSLWRARVGVGRRASGQGGPFAPDAFRPPSGPPDLILRSGPGRAGRDSLISGA
jgi:hypothetical protein